MKRSIVFVIFALSLLALASLRTKPQTINVHWLYEASPELVEKTTSEVSEVSASLHQLGYEWNSDTGIYIGDTNSLLLATQNIDPICAASLTKDIAGTVCNNEKNTAVLIVKDWFEQFDSRWRIATIAHELVHASQIKSACNVGSQTAYGDARFISEGEAFLIDEWFSKSLPNSPKTQPQFSAEEYLDMLSTVYVERYMNISDTESIVEVRTFTAFLLSKSPGGSARGIEVFDDFWSSYCPGSTSMDRFLDSFGWTKDEALIKYYQWIEDLTK